MEANTIRIRRFNEFEQAQLRFLNEGISISNTNKSIMIGYNEVLQLIYDKNLYLHIIYKKNQNSSLFIADEQTEIKKEIVNDMAKKCKIKPTFSGEKSKGLENLLYKGECQLASNRDSNNKFLMTQKRIIFLNNITNEQLIINLKDINILEQKGQTALKINYGINMQEEMYFNKIEEILNLIIKYKVIEENYEDNMNLSEEKKLKKNLPIKKMFLLICGILLIVLLLYFLNP